MLSNAFITIHCILSRGGASQSERSQILITRRNTCLNQFRMQRRGALIKCHGWRCWRCWSRIISVSFPLCFRLSQLIFSCDGDTYNSPLGPLARSSCSTIGTPMLMRSWTVRGREQNMERNMTMIKGEGGAGRFTLGLTSHRFWCRHNDNDDYSADTDSCVSINIACSKEEGEECETVTTCFPIR